MSATYRITPRAAEDLKTIGRYTLRMRGREQRDRYLRALDRHFARLAENPHLGRERNDITPGYYSSPHRFHMVFYLIRDGGIDIIGVPHGRMDILNYFVGDEKKTII